MTSSSKPPVTDLRRAAVVGAGTMGGGIAAQFADKGIPVLLLDTTAEAAASGLERQRLMGGFVNPWAAALVETGGITTDIERLSDADWIVEAIVERVDLKQDLYRRVDAVRRPGSIVSSNTSTLRLAALTGGLPETFVRDFVVTHFFNPPKVMALMELVGSAATDPTTLRRVRDHAERVLGKTVVVGRDTPGFIANRVGCYWMAMAAIEAIAFGLTVEEADAVAGPPFGVPRTGVFGLFDLIGLDLVPLVWGALLDSLPTDDALHRYAIPAHPLFRQLIAEGRLGRKAHAGFYRQDPATKLREGTNLATGAYRPGETVAAMPDLVTLLDGTDRAARYARRVADRLRAYVEAVTPSIADGPEAVDTAMRLGYSWREGPFALLARLDRARATP